MSALLERHAPVVPKLSRRERAAYEELLWRGVVADPLNFLHVAHTVDEHAEALGRPAIQPFPVCGACGKDPVANDAWALTGTPPLQLAVCRAHGRRHKPYFAPLVRRWQAEEQIADLKSRQLMISWLYIALYGWLALTRPGTKIAFQSQNETKAAEMVERFAIMYRLLPSALQRFGPLSDAPKAKARAITGQIAFTHPHGVLSEIFAIPCGGNQTRMYTFTGILMDEAQFWENDEDFEESWAAAHPAVKGGGKMTAISSVNHERCFHYRLCNDQVVMAA